MPLSGADEKSIQRIREGQHKAYPEQRYVDPALIPGAVITFLCVTFLLFSFVGPDFGPIPFEMALLGTVIGLCIWAPGIFVWLSYRRTYTYLGMWRFQLALSITALELANHGHYKIKPIISPSYPAEYLYLPNFVAFGPGNLLKRLQGMDIEAETLTLAAHQADRIIASLFGTMGALTLLGGLATLLISFILFAISGAMNLFLFVLAILLLIMSTASLIYARAKARSLERNELDEPVSKELSQLVDDAEQTAVDSPDAAEPISKGQWKRFDYASSEVSVSEVLDLLRSRFSHPIRLLLLDDYGQLEYTGRTYLTGNEIELREAILLPSNATY